LAINYLVGTEPIHRRDHHVGKTMFQPVHARIIPEAVKIKDA